MNIKAIFLLAVMTAFSTAASAQGFAGLGTTADGFKQVVRGKEFEFPLDYGAHPGFRIEWWYITANLVSDEGAAIGLQWTLFRQASSPNPEDSNWSTSEFWMGHAAVTDANNHFHAEKLARGGSGQAGARSDAIDIWIDDWTYSATSADRLTLKAAGDRFSYSLNLHPTGDEVRHGENGYSVKSAQGQASYYFSHPFLEVSGSVTINDKVHTVTGNAWLDREWSSQPLADNQEGWDWFSIKFDDGNRLMAFSLRDTNGDSYVSGSWISEDGSISPLAGGKISLAPVAQSSVAGRSIPTSWRISIPSRKVELNIEALNPQSWMSTSIPYWEGPVTVSGSHQALGYLEMTGY